MREILPQKILIFDIFFSFLSVTPSQWTPSSYNPSFSLLLFLSFIISLSHTHTLVVTIIVDWMRDYWDFDWKEKPEMQKRAEILIQISKVREREREDEREAWGTLMKLLWKMVH